MAKFVRHVRVINSQIFIEGPILVISVNNVTGRVNGLVKNE